MIEKLIVRLKTVFPREKIIQEDDIVFVYYGIITIGWVRILNKYVPANGAPTSNAKKAAERARPFWYQPEQLKIDYIADAFYKYVQWYKSDFPALASVCPLDITLIDNTIKIYAHSVLDVQRISKNGTLVPLNIGWCPMLADRFIAAERSLMVEHLLRNLLPMPIADEMLDPPEKHDVLSKCRDLTLIHGVYKTLLVSNIFGEIASCNLFEKSQGVYKLKVTTPSGRKSYKGTIEEIKNALPYMLPEWYSRRGSDTPAGSFEQFYTEVFPRLQKIYNERYPDVAARWSLDIDEWSQEPILRVADFRFLLDEFSTDNNNSTPLDWWVADYKKSINLLQ